MEADDRDAFLHEHLTKHGQTHGAHGIASPVSSKRDGLQQRPGLEPATTLLPDARPSTDPEVGAFRGT